MKVPTAGASSRINKSHSEGPGGGSPLNCPLTLATGRLDISKDLTRKEQAGGLRILTARISDLETIFIINILLIFHITYIYKLGGGQETSDCPPHYFLFSSHFGFRKLHHVTNLTSLVNRKGPGRFVVCVAHEPQSETNLAFPTRIVPILSITYLVACWCSTKSGNNYSSKGTQLEYVL